MSIDPNGQFIDETITCAGCARPFVWTVKDQEYQEQKALTHRPRYCRPCRVRRRAESDAKAKSGTVPVPVSVPVKHKITCSKCGKPGSVPFTPTPGRDVLCNECHSKRQKNDRKPARE